MACQKTDVISQCIGFAVLTKRKRKQNTVYISDKHRRVEYRLSCLPYHKEESAKNFRQKLRHSRDSG